MPRTDHHINYLKKCECTKTIPKALQVTLTPQVPVVNSLLQVPLVWWRYIDDIFMIWLHTQEELYFFIDALNNIHGSKKFMVDISETQANFLDVTIYKDPDGNITTGLLTNMH